MAEKNEQQSQNPPAGDPQPQNPPPTLGGQPPRPSATQPLTPAIKPLNIGTPPLILPTPAAPAAAVDEHGHPERDDDGKLTRRGMETVLARGGSVLSMVPKTHNGTDDKGKPTKVTVHHPQLLTHAGHLPTAAALAKGNAQATADALAEARRRRAEAELEIAELEASQGTSK